MSALDALQQKMTDNYSAHDFLWWQVLKNLKPFAAQALIRQHCHLIAFDGASAQVGISSPPLLKLAQLKVPNLKAAFEATVGHPVQISIQTQRLKPIQIAPVSLPELGGQGSLENQAQAHAVKCAFDKLSSSTRAMLSDCRVSISRIDCAQIVIIAPPVTWKRLSKRIEAISKALAQMYGADFRLIVTSSEVKICDFFPDSRLRVSSKYEIERVPFLACRVLDPQCGLPLDCVQSLPAKRVVRNGA